MTKNLYLDIHVLQTVPSSNLNRDDSGSPKTALYGGVTRSRVSSQSWKRAMRQMFREDLPDNGAGIRTKEVSGMIAQALMAHDTTLDEDAALEKADAILGGVGIKVKDHKTGALLLISRGQVAKLAEYALSHETLDKKALKPIFKGEQSLDLALFGRMVADNPELNVEATAQVAHAVSTHAVVPEFDYFTAMDDLKPDDTAGAAMLGTIEYNSATLYRYTNVNLRELIEDLGVEGALAGVAEYIKAFILAMPTGKQNTFANKTVPSYVMLNLRTDTPLNLVSAFERPVLAGDDTGYVAKSVMALEKEFKTTQQFVDMPRFTLVLGELGEAGERVDNLKALITEASMRVQAEVNDANTDD